MLLPRPPATQDKRQWEIWFDAVYRILAGITGLVWNAIDFTGSKLSDLETRPHSDLQSVEGADTSSSNATQDKHVSNAQAKGWQDHKNATGNPHGTAMSDIATITSVKKYDTLEWNGSAWVNVEGGNAVYATEVDDAGSNIIYIGEAAPGTATSAALWRIQKIDTSGGDCVIIWADGNSNFDNIWDDHLTLSYS